MERNFEVSAPFPYTLKKPLHPLHLLFYCETSDCDGAVFTMEHFTSAPFWQLLLINSRSVQIYGVLNVDHSEASTIFFAPNGDRLRPKIRKRLADLRF